MKKYTFFLVFILLFNCGRWKTTKMKPDHLCTVNPGDAAGNVMLKYDDDDILNISFKIKIHNNIYIADNILKRIQVYDKNCKPVLCIGEKSPVSAEDSNEIRFSKFQFSIIQDMAVDSSGNMYIQNSFAPTQKNNGKDFGFSPSYILVFDEKGNLLYTLGKTGSPDIPFNSIESLYMDKDDRLFVLARSYDMWSVFRFTNKRRDFTVNIIETNFKDTEGRATYNGKIERIIPFQSGDNFLISVAYYDTINFMYRKIYNYSILNDKISRTIFSIADPKNEIFNMSDDKHIYLWDINEKDIRFMICNFKGDIVNNILLRFPVNLNSYDEMETDNSGHFYSYHVTKKGIDILEWR